MLAYQTWHISRAVSRERLCLLLSQQRQATFTLRVAVHVAVCGISCGHHSWCGCPCTTSFGSGSALNTDAAMLVLQLTSVVAFLHFCLLSCYQSTSYFLSTQHGIAAFEKSERCHHTQCRSCEHQDFIYTIIVFGVTVWWCMWNMSLASLQDSSSAAVCSPHIGSMSSEQLDASMRSASGSVGSHVCPAGDMTVVNSTMTKQAHLSPEADVGAKQQDAFSVNYEHCQHVYRCL